ncbi:uncharacterized protein B0H18DRAFT_1183593, partial [Fomitopsis serialis]|uniref:uncharacterized protein n=1 Tax=Fomitopsis serialis TaxID=139415 RepID=UPI0020085013
TGVPGTHGPIAQYHEHSGTIPPSSPGRTRSWRTACRLRCRCTRSLWKLSSVRLLTAMQTYARQGDASMILVNDDGLRLLSVEERDTRIAFYANHGIGWVARPKLDDAPDGFQRAG